MGFAASMKFLAILLLGLMAILMAILLVRTLTFPSRQPNVGKCSPKDADFIELTVDMTTHFQDAIRLKTIAWSPSEQSLPEILLMHKLLEKSFPHIHKSLLVKREVIATYSLLYTIEGSDPSLTPYMLMAHMDVVPVDQQDWDYPPFEGKIVDGYLYGRGTIDIKNGVMGIMEALEFRLKKGQNPVRPLLVAFGHDEEVMGRDGAGEISKVLSSRGVKLEFVLDEGSTIVKNMFPGIDAPVAMISVAEKGATSVNISVDAVASGHSSLPGKETNIGILAKALSRIEQTPFPSMFGRGPEINMLEALASEAKGPWKFVLSNLWLFHPLMNRLLSSEPSSNALIRTTTALTMIHGGTKINVLPPSAWAVINHRIHPAQTIEEVVGYDQQLIGDYRVKIQRIEEWDITPAPVSPHINIFGYQTIARSIKQIFPEAVITPGMTLGNTDTKYHWERTKNIYRFSPTYMMPEDVSRIHGVNERIGIDNYQQTINFYYHVTINADAKNLDEMHSHKSEL